MPNKQCDERMQIQIKKKQNNDDDNNNIIYC